MHVFYFILLTSPCVVCNMITNRIIPLIQSYSSIIIIVLIQGDIMTKFLSILLIFASSNLFAALVDRGNGLIYDDEEDLTWLYDANYLFTSSQDLDGRKSFSQAVSWVESFEYAGADNWRLPNASPNPVKAFNQVAGELGYMFYVNAASTKNIPIDTSQIPLFENIKLDQGYWLSSEVSTDPSKAWVFHLNNGLQADRGISSQRYVWPVHDGDIANDIDSATVPTPASAFLFGSGLLGLMVTRQRTNGSD